VRPELLDARGSRLSFANPNPAESLKRTSLAIAGHLVDRPTHVPADCSTLHQIPSPMQGETDTSPGDENAILLQRHFGAE